jgi:hypothetical protein
MIGITGFPCHINNYHDFRLGSFLYFSGISKRNKRYFKLILSIRCITYIHQSNTLGGHNHDTRTTTQALYNQLIQSAKGRKMGM